MHLSKVPTSPSLPIASDFLHGRPSVQCEPRSVRGLTRVGLWMTEVPQVLDVQSLGKCSEDSGGGRPAVATILAVSFPLPSLPLATEQTAPCRRGLLSHCSVQAKL